MKTYDSDFFTEQAPGSLRSARIVVTHVIELIHPRSVVDVGCGTGAWAEDFREFGVSDVMGVDGSYLARERLLFPAHLFVAADLTKRVPIERHFDLAVCLEVAEHLPPSQSTVLVAELARLATAVLFSAAIPNQGGTGHINERWQDEWAAMFANEGLEAVDAIRPRIWSDAAVEFWYAQNMLLYLRKDQVANVARPEVDWPRRVVHPSLYALQHANRRRQPFVRLIHRIRRAASRQLRKMLR